MRFRENDRPFPEVPDPVTALSGQLRENFASQKENFEGRKENFESLRERSEGIKEIFESL